MSKEPMRHHSCEGSKVDIASLVLGAVLGAVLSVPISYYFYRRSSQETPDWAKGLVARFPSGPPLLEQLIEYYHEALEAGAIRPDPFTGRVKCPKCGAPARDFENADATDEEHDRSYRGVRCPHCTWEELSEV